MYHKLILCRVNVFAKQLNYEDVDFFNRDPNFLEIKTRKILTWLTSFSELWLLLVLIILFISLFLSLVFVRELLLRVGVIVGLIWWILTQSLELLFGDILAGKLRVFVHCVKLRTIVSFNHSEYHTNLKLKEITGQYIPLLLHITSTTKRKLFWILTCVVWTLILNRPFSGLSPTLHSQTAVHYNKSKWEAVLPDVYKDTLNFEKCYYKYFEIGI